ncbi:MAG: 1-acyl-sn-glycerol-3-phosphate acyltransferase, partial [Simkaniaceae bacterium]|nr:1-acyl-sn-glycerol-3-phosphate acyltransferase [Simkaniaceae bacterium]
MKIICSLFAWCLRCGLALRYRIHVQGLDEIISKKRLRKGKLLFLPNHPAEIDPLIIESLIMGRFRPRPLIVEHFYYLTGARLIFNLVRGIPIPNFATTANAWKIKKAKQIFKQIKQGISQNDNFLIYPAGNLKLTSEEIIGGSSFVHNLIEESKDVEIILVRTTGLWGSMFSRALTGELPDFWKVLVSGLKIILKNGVFFVPKRDVFVEFSH